MVMLNAQNSYIVYRATDDGGERSGTDSAWHGAGIYFTDNKTEASWYGDTIKKYIITINKPFDLTKIQNSSVQGSGLVKLFANTKGLSDIKIGKYTFKQLNDLINKLETEIDPNKIEIYDGNKEPFKHLSYEYNGKEYFLRNKTESEYNKLDYIKGLFISNILYEKYGVERMPIRVSEAINPFSFTEILKQNGYDGIIAENSNFSSGNEYVVFDKSQVKEINENLNENSNLENLKLQRSQKREVNDEWDFNFGTGQYGEGVYAFFHGDKSMIDYYTKNGESLYSFEIPKKYVFDLSNKKLDFWEAKTFMFKNPQYKAFIFNHSGHGIPSSKQVLITDPSIIQSIEKEEIKEQQLMREFVKNVISEGIRVFHGSDRKFDVFDINKVGTGDGKALGGYGIYFSDSPEVSKRHATKNGFLKPFEITNGNYFDLDESLDEETADELISRLKTYGSEGNHVSEENFQQFQTDFIEYIPNINNKQVYEWLSYVLGGDREASAFLEKVGYIETKFKDKWDSNAINYVIFNPKNISKATEDEDQEMYENRFLKRQEEKYKSCLMSDLSRMEIVEDFFNEIKKNPKYNVDEPDFDELLDTWDGYEDQVYIQNNLNNNEIMFWEGWVDSCWEALYDKPEYKKLNKKEAIEKVIKDRFPRIAEEFEMKIKSFNYFVHNDEFIMKVVFERKVEMLSEDSRRVDWKKQIEYISKKLNVKLLKFLGGGLFGIAYAIPGNRVLKLTEDEGEVYSSKSIIGEESEYLANIYKVYAIKGHPDKKAIIQERLQPLTQKYKDGFTSFVNKMEDFLIQQGSVFGGDMTIADFLRDSDLYQDDFNYFLEQESFGDDDYAGIVYGDLLSIFEEAAGYGIDLSDIHEDNCGMKNGHMAMFDIK